MPQLRCLPVFALLSLLFVSCASQESFRVPVLRPAPVDLGQHDLVAIDRFSGEGSEVINTEMTTALREAVNPMTGQPDFEVVHRADVDRMIDDMRRYPGVDLESADSPVAKWKRARIQITGNTHTYGVDEVNEATEWVDPQGFPHTTFVRRATAHVGVTIEALDSEGNKVFDRVTFDEEATTATKAVDQEPAPIDYESLLAAARSRIVQGYLRRVMPHTDYVSVHLFIDGDLPQLQVGNGFAKTGDWESALDSYQSAADLATGDLGEVRYKALHNAGVALLYTNRFDEARNALKEAYALGQENVSLRQLEMVNQREQELARLQQQGDRGVAAPGR